MTLAQLNAMHRTVKKLLKTASVIEMDGDVYQILECNELTFTAETKGFLPFTLGYDEVSLKRDLIY